MAAIDDLKNLAGGISSPPNTRTKTSYAATLHAKVGTRYFAIGGITEFHEEQGQAVDEEWAIRRGTAGRPDLLTPQNLTTRILSLKRYELYGLTMRELFALNRMASIADQGVSLSVRVSWSAPSGLTGFTFPGTSGVSNPTGVGATVLNSFLAGMAEKKVHQYVDCVFQKYGETVSATNVIVMADASIVYRDVEIIQ